MTTPEKHLLVYVSSLPESAEARFETERQAAQKGALLTGLVWPASGAGYDWSLVRRQIEQADAFLLLSGREYGPVTPTGIGNQHRELVHAQSLNKPVYAIIHNAPATGPAQDQLKLTDFRRQLMALVPYKIWHLGDELSVHAGAIISAWQRKGVGSWSNARVASDRPLSIAPGVGILPDHFRTPEVTARSRGDGPAREDLTFMVQANVYRGGNLSRHVVSITIRTDRLWRDLLPLLRLCSSEDRLRALVERTVSDEASKLLLAEHPGSHAVDDVRVERNQFRQLLSRWSGSGFIKDKRDRARTRWMLAD